MNALTANARFSQVPSIDISRSIIPMSWTHKTTFNSGKLVPFSVLEVLPGDTWKMDTSVLCRMSTPVFPVMDNCFLDVYYFFVPNRLVWSHWKEFNGENNVSSWVNSTQYFIPQCRFNCYSGSIADHMGLPVGGDLTVSALPGRAYRLIYNEWFRDQNLIDPLLVRTTDQELDDIYGDLLPVCKMHDYFTSCLPSPQKGESTLIPLGEYASVVTGPVRSYGDCIMTGADGSHPNGSESLYFRTIAGTAGNISSSAKFVTGGATGTIQSSSQLALDQGEQSPNDGDLVPAVPANLYADMTTITSTINDLRKAFAIQRMYERDARGGSRYTEILRSHFGVTAPDASLQRPELLNARRIPVNISQVIQTSSTDATSPIGTASAFSKTTDYGESFEKSFTEHGFIIGVMCVRPMHSYQQGINRMWNRRSRFDFYWPALANIGEQAVLSKEIYHTSDEVYNNSVFGYQEAWADYRYHPSTVSGAFRSNADDGSLDAWHYADNFRDKVYLSEEFINESDVNIGRTLAVQDSAISDQFLMDMSFNATVTRPMPLYSVPGLLDHN